MVINLLSILSTIPHELYKKTLRTTVSLYDIFGDNKYTLSILQSYYLDA